MIQTVKLAGAQLLGLVTACKELLRIRTVVNNLMKECEEISEYMGGLVNELTPNCTVLSPQKAGNKRAQIMSQPSNISDG